MKVSLADWREISSHSPVADNSRSLEPLAQYNQLTIYQNINLKANLNSSIYSKAF